MAIFGVGASERRPTMYGTTNKKITHIIQEHPNNGLYGFWYTKCGKYIHPIALHDDAPEETRMCKLCAKKEAVHD